MPTIAQLPTANLITAADEVPISQDGLARSASIGALLSSTQPAIIVDSPSLLGRTSLGSGGPEQINIGTGLSLADGTLAALGVSPAAYPPISSFSAQSDLVISNQGTPMLMQANLLRGLFSAGQNVTIDLNGTISASDFLTTGGTIVSVSSIGTLQVINALSSQDLVPVSHLGSTVAISYGNFLNGITIDEAQPAATAGDSGSIWVAQGGNVMTSQSFGAIWSWIAKKLPTYMSPIVEITNNTNLDATTHNGRLLICSQPVTLMPLSGNMGNGFFCTVLNASTGTVTLGSGFVSSSGGLLLAPWQSATLSCATYSAGTIAFAAMPATPAITSPPGQVVGLVNSNLTNSTVTVSWQAPLSGGAVTFYIVQYRLAGATSWANGASVAGVAFYQITGLQPGTNYDVSVQAQNAAGNGIASSLTVTTSSSAQTIVPPQVGGLTASPTSPTTVLLSWSAQTGSSAATTFTVQYRVTGSPSWTSLVTGISGTGTSIVGLQAATSYDFEVIGINSAGAGPVSSAATVVTLAASQSVSSITWNLLPTGTYAHGSGAIGVNTLVSPASAPVQFGFSPSATTPPSSWTAATLVNANLWGAYVPTPATAGSWYAWAEGVDGSARTVSTGPFTVQ